MFSNGQLVRHDGMPGVQRFVREAGSKSPTISLVEGLAGHGLQQVATARLEPILTEAGQPKYDSRSFPTH